MQDIKNKKFEIDNYFDFTIMDEYANRWDGDSEPIEVSIGISSNDESCSIAEVKVKDFDDLTKWQVTQVADNATEIEVREFLKEKHAELKDLLYEKLNNPDSNGQC
ncbi:hypothetical protein [Epilithonimonas caeni]|uniref:hypothetical protein n=1 Tax=Epilithonimonas caeni TaxID=365343 RepID=UPI0004291A3A|nr:hypothetical protein [Epilithonimonas caeni]